MAAKSPTEESHSNKEDTEGSDDDLRCFLDQEGPLTPKPEIEEIFEYLEFLKEHQGKSAPIFLLLGKAAIQSPQIAHDLKTLYDNTKNRPTRRTTSPKPKASSPSTAAVALPDWKRYNALPNLIESEVNNFLQNVPLKTASADSRAREKMADGFGIQIRDEIEAIVRDLEGSSHALTFSTKCDALQTILDIVSKLITYKLPDNAPLRLFLRIRGLALSEIHLQLQTALETLSDKDVKDLASKTGWYDSLEKEHDAAWGHPKAYRLGDLPAHLRFVHLYVIWAKDDGHDVARKMLYETAWDARRRSEQLERYTRARQGRQLETVVRESRVQFEDTAST